MKAKEYTLLLAIVIFILTLCSAYSQGVIIEHSGTTDPTTEGFDLSGNGTVGAVTDIGINAWSMNGGAGATLYTQTLTPQEQLEFEGADWDLSITIRAPSVGVAATFSTGAEMFQLIFGSSFVKTGTSALSPIFHLNDSDSYNNFQLIYDGANNDANLWVNGVERISDISGASNNSTPQVAFGIYSITAPAHANWNLVSLSVPEPSLFSLLLLGSGILIYSRRIKKHSRT